MPCKLSNALSTFMRIMTQALQPFIGKFIVIYFDNILVQSKQVDQHLQHLRKVFEVLRKHTLCINLKKCIFLVNRLLLLGFNISAYDIQVDDSKTKAITDWPIPKNIKELQSFHGLATFYKKFIRNFSTLASPLTDIMNKGNFTQGAEQQVSFNALKDRLRNVPILALPDFSKLFEVEVDASGKGVGVVPYQEDKPVEFFSEKLSEFR